MSRVSPLLIVAVLAGCGPLNRNEGPPTPTLHAQEQLAAFRAVCDGTPATDAPDYAHHDDHRAAVVEGKGDRMALATGRLPKDWTIEFPYTEIAEVDVVVCGERMAAKAVRFCPDSNGQKKAIRWNTATYSYTARSARTGKPLGKAKTIKARSHRCPTNLSVVPEYAPLDQYALISKAALKDFAEPFLDD